ncbi:tyrosine-type recombinase/integrase [Paenibacillus chungangensis]|uniref:Tyrosine-type recombinase/integrase n=1 Tax=Paenibacillus chungangensis TaxID=696535 RepID=A0ABW3HWG2_9BACL
MNNDRYTGPFKDHIVRHVALKQSVGYKYETDAAHLERFDRFTQEKYPEATTLTKEIVLDWCGKKMHETRANQLSRTSIIRQFGIYLDQVGVAAYVIPKRYYPAETPYVPYIYSIDKLQRFFAETDRCRYCSECPYRHLIMPLFFRMIYTCGLRVSEARLLTVGDVDLKQGILSVHHSKKDNSRLVPMSDELAERCRSYFREVHSFPKDTDTFFPALGGKPMTLTNAYSNFRRFLWRAGISHGGRGKGPRIHDFRHTYACHCLKKWVRQGKDLAAYLPILKTYLGHDSFAETAYYLRLTADVFPDLTLKLEGRYPDIIPSLERAADEAY